MNIKERLEAEHSKKCTAEIVAYIGNDEKKFLALLSIFLGTDSVLSQRAAWPLSYLGDTFHEAFLKHMPALLKKTTEPGVHSAVKRNVLRLLQDMEIPEKFQAPVIDSCFRFLRDPNEAVAVRAFAITVAADICSQYGELAGELRLILQEILALPHTAAISVRVRRALKALEKGN